MHSKNVPTFSGIRIIEALRKSVLRGVDNEGAVLLASQYPARSLSDKVLRSFPSLKLAKSGNRVIVHSEQMRTEAAI